MWYNEINWTGYSDTTNLTLSSFSKGCITLCKPFNFSESSFLFWTKGIISWHQGLALPPSFPLLTGFFTFFFLPTCPLPFLSLGNVPMDDFWWEVMLHERSQWSPVDLCSCRARLGWAEFRPLSPSCPILCPQEYLLALTQPGCLTQTRTFFL